MLPRAYNVLRLQTDHMASSWKVAAGTLKIQSRTADRRQSSSWGRLEERRLRIIVKIAFYVQSGRNE
jgi:hypothetical protein